MSLNNVISGIVGASNNWLTKTFLWVLNNLIISIKVIDLSHPPLLAVLIPHLLGAFLNSELIYMRGFLVRCYDHTRIRGTGIMCYTDQGITSHAATRNTQ